MTTMGIDVSLTHTAMWCGEDFHEIKCGKLRGVARLENLYREAMSFLGRHRPKLVLIEGYAFAAKARHHRLGEAGGVVRLACLHAKVEKLFTLPPSTLKKFFTGDGRASKEDMIEEAFARGHVVSNDNVADACALWYASQNKSLLHRKGEQEEL